MSRPLKRLAPLVSFPIRLKTAILSFFLAFVFWLMTSLNREYDVRLHFAVDFNFPREGLIVVDSLPGEVMLNVSGVGWDLFKNTAFTGKPLRVVLSSPTTTKSLSKASMFSLFSEQLGDIRLNHVVTDAININIQQQVIRPIPVIFNDSSVSLEEGFRITSPIRVLPDTVYVTGPEEYVQEIPKGYILHLNTPQPIDGNFQEDLAVNLSDSELIRVDAATVNVKFSVEKFVRKSIAIQIGTLNFQSSRYYRPFIKDEVVQISYTVKSLSAPKVLAEQFLVVADYRNLNRKERTISLEILDYPAELVSEVQITPDELRVWYEKKR